MGSITHLDKSTLDVIKKKMQFVLQQAEEELGIQIQVGSCRYSDRTGTFKVEVALLQEDGAAYDPAKESFLKCCQMYGFEPEDLGKEFIFGSRTYKIVGMKSRNRRYPILAQRDDGKKFKFPFRPILQSWGRSGPLVSSNGFDSFQG